MGFHFKCLSRTILRDLILFTSEISIFGGSYCSPKSGRLLELDVNGKYPVSLTFSDG